MNKHHNHKNGHRTAPELKETIDFFILVDAISFQFEDCFKIDELNSYIEELGNREVIKKWT